MTRSNHFIYASKNVIDVEHNVEDIKSAMRHQIEHGLYESDKLYGDGKAGERISNLLAKAPLDIQKRLSY